METPNWIEDLILGLWWCKNADDLIHMLLVGWGCCFWAHGGNPRGRSVDFSLCIGVKCVVWDRPVLELLLPPGCVVCVSTRYQILQLA